MVTKVEKLEKTLIQSIKSGTDFLDKVLQLAPDAIFILDKDGIFRYLNPKASEIIGVPESELLNNHFIEFVDSKHRRRSLENFKRLLRGNSVDNFTLKLDARGNRKIYIDLRFTLLEDFLDSPSVLFVARDITEVQSSQRRLETLHSVGKSVTSEIYLPNILEEVLEAVTRPPFGFNYATITLRGLAEERHRVRTIAGKNVPKEWLEMADYSMRSKDIRVDVIKRGQTEVIDSWDPRFDKSIYKKFNLNEVIRVFVPIKSRNEVFGTLEAGYQKSYKNKITNEEIDTLEALTDYLAIALKNSELVKSKQNAILELERVHEISETATSSRHILESLETVIEKSTTLFGANAASISLCSKSDTFLHPVVSKGYDYVPELDFEKPEGITGWVAKYGKPLLIRDVQKSRLYYQVLKDVKSELAIPLKYEDEVIGVLNINSSQKSAFDQHSQKTLEMIANQVSFIIERLKYSSALEKLGESFLYTQEIDLLYQEIVELASEIMDTKVALLWIVTEDAKALTLGSFTGVDISNPESENIPIDKGVTGASCTERMTQFVPIIVRALFE